MVGISLSVPVRDDDAGADEGDVVAALQWFSPGLVLAVKPFEIRLGVARWSPRFAREVCSRSGQGHDGQH